MSTSPEMRLRDAAPRSVPALDHASLQTRGRRRRRRRLALQSSAAVLLVVAGVGVASLLELPTVAPPGDQPLAQEPDAPGAWPSASGGGVDYRLWAFEDAPLDDLTLTTSDFDADCPWVLAFRLPSGERGGWSVCPDPFPEDTVSVYPHQMRGTRGGMAAVVLIISSDHDNSAVDVTLSDGSSHRVALADLAALDAGGRELQVGLLPTAWDVGVEAVGDRGWWPFG